MRETHEAGMTAEQRVKAKWPDAYVRGLISGGEFVYSDTYGKLSRVVDSISEAWADAASRLED